MPLGIASSRMRWTKLGRAAPVFLYVLGQPFVARTPFEYARWIPPAVIDAATSFEYLFAQSTKVPPAFHWTDSSATGELPFHLPSILEVSGRKSVP
jgi:hypothetical protein